jgi:hypothetical protein
MNKEDFFEILTLIGYSTKGVYPNEYIVDNLGNEKPMRVLNESVEVTISEGVKLHIYYLACKIERIEKSLSIQSIKDDSTTGFFILLRRV